ncbi:unnamed protein product [Gordionus sp. m RMFG-2023]
MVYFSFIFKIRPCYLPSNVTECACDNADAKSGFSYVNDSNSDPIAILCQYNSLFKTTKSIRKTKILDRTLTHLTMRYNNIGMLQGDPFFGFTNLEYLAINNGKLWNISGDAFMSLAPKLRILDLQINNLKTIPTSSLAPLTHLRVLDLSYNLLSHISGRALWGLSNLRALHLEANEIAKIDKDAFVGLEETLQELELQNNQIKIIPKDAFNYLRALKKLDLARNLIELLTPQKAFSSLRSLQTLNLGHNHIKLIDGEAFVGLNNLRVLFLHDNHIDNIVPTNFQHLSSVEYLVLSENRIRFLTPFCFKEMRILRTLNLENNKISTVADNAFKGLEASLSYLHLKGNLLDKVPKDSLKNLKNLWVLNLADNVIKESKSDDFGDNLKNVLGSLHMSGNLLNSVPTKALSSFKTLWYLDLSRNEISYLANKCFPSIPLLEILNLADNKINTIHRLAFDNLNSSPLKRVILAGNSLTSFPPSDIFFNMSSMRALDFGKNKISQLTPHNFRGLDDVMSPSQVRSLDLSRNQIETVFPETFNDLQKCCESLDLSFNRMKMLRAHTFINSLGIKGINISHNHLKGLEDETFVNMLGLHTLNLSNNHISELNSKMFKGIPYLNTLDLSRNHITHLQSLVFKYVTEIEYLDLKYNNLTFVSAHALAGLHRITSLSLANNKLFTLEYGTFNRISFNSIQYLDFMNNPWMCDCKIRWLREWIQELQSYKGDSHALNDEASNKLQKTLCYAPHHLMNTCLMCIPSEAYVCIVDDEYSDILSKWMPGPLRKKLSSFGTSKDHFSWIQRARRERKYKRLIILLTTLLALSALAICILTSFILWWWKQRRRNNTSDFNRNVSSNPDTYKTTVGTENEPLNRNLNGANNNNTLINESLIKDRDPLRNLGRDEKDLRLYSIERDVNNDGVYYSDFIGRKQMLANRQLTNSVSSNEFFRHLETQIDNFKCKNTETPGKNRPGDDIIYRCYHDGKDLGHICHPESHIYENNSIVISAENHLDKPLLNNLRHSCHVSSDLRTDNDTDNNIRKNSNNFINNNGNYLYDTIKTFANKNEIGGKKTKEILKKSLNSCSISSSNHHQYSKILNEEPGSANNLEKFTNITNTQRKNDQLESNPNPHGRRANHKSYHTQIPVIGQPFKIFAQCSSSEYMKSSDNSLTTKNLELTRTQKLADTLYNAYDGCEKSNSISVFINSFDNDDILDINCEWDKGAIIKQTKTEKIAV